MFSHLLLITFLLGIIKLHLILWMCLILFFEYEYKNIFSRHSRTSIFSCPVRRSIFSRHLLMSVSPCHICMSVSPRHLTMPYLVLITRSSPTILQFVH